MAGLSVHPSSRSDRRKFLRSIVRWPLLAGLAIVTGTLFARRRAPGAVCTKQLFCRGCASLRDCALPRAADFRRQNPT